MRYICLFILSIFLLLPFPNKAQINIGFDKVGFEGSGVSKNLVFYNVRFNQQAQKICSEISAKGSVGQSSIDLKYGLKIKPDDLLKSALMNFIEDGKLLVYPSDLLPIEDVPDIRLNCSYNILDVSGSVSCYNLNNIQKFISNKNFNANVSYEDQLEIVSPVATTLELVFEVSAGLVSGATFCNPENSIGLAKVNLSTTLGNQTAAARGELTLKDGSFLETKDVGEKKLIRLNVPAGKSTVKMKITGAIFVQSVVQGISPLNAIMGAMNTGVVGGKLMAVHNFTGVDGSPLPSGIKINGLITKIDYTQDPPPAIPCPTYAKPKIDVVDASCGLVNGKATITASDVPNPTFEWSNGRTGREVVGLAKGSYYVIVRDGTGCFNTYPFEVKEINPPPKISLPAYVALKPGESVQIDATDSTNAGLTYSWSNGAKTPKVTLTTPGIYRLTVVNQARCTFYYSVEIIEKTGYWMSDGNVKADVGEFYDDGGPTKNYTDNQTRLVTICPATPTKFIVLNFSQVSIFNYNNQDVLRVFDGTDLRCPLNINLSSPAAFTASQTSGGCLTVLFKATSADVSSAGWRAGISVTDKPPTGCGNEITSCSGTFSDSGGETGNYSPNEFKIYNLCPPSGSGLKKVTTLSFTAVDISTNDHLAVYDGVGTTCILQSEVKTPQSFTASASSNGCLTVVFDSDGSGQGKGWVANISCSDTPTKSPVHCSCGTNPVPSNTCEDAPLIDNLQVFCGISSIDYAAIVTGNLSVGFCGIIHNNSFFRFIADDSSVQLGYKARGGTHKLCEGVQVAILQPDGVCNAPTTKWKYLSCQAFDGLMGTGTVKVNGLTKGQEYFVMIDGSYGSECLYSLTAEKGFAACPLKISQEEIICQSDGRYSVRIPFSGTGSKTAYKVYDKNSSINKIKEITFVDDGKTSSVVFGPYQPGHEYNIVITGGRDLEACALTVKGKSSCPKPPCNLAANLTSTCFDKTGDVIISGELKNAVLPVSIVSSAYSAVLFPDSVDTNRLTIKIKKEDLKQATTFYITDINFCQTEQTVNVPVCDDCPKEMSLYPNPTTNQIWFRYPCPGFTISIYDVTGRWLGNRSVTSIDPTDIYSVNISDLPTGVYLLTLRNDTASITQRFVKL